MNCHDRSITMMRFPLFVVLFEIIVVNLNFHKCQTAHTLEISAEDRLKAGKQEYGKVLSRAELSTCWEEAVSRLEDGCKDLTDVEQSRLAIAFTNCHLEKSGLPTYPCGDGQTIKQCTRDMTKSILAFNTYTEFYTHTSEICFYLQSKIWQQKTEETVNRLTSSSQEIADQLEASLDNQNMVLQSQKDSLTNQKEIMANEAYLKNALKSSAENAKEAFLDMKKATAQQKEALMETFDGLFKGVDRITKLQSMLLGEFMTLHSLGFYLVSILACYIITSAPRTAAARLWLFIILSIHIIIERLIVRWSVNDKSSQETATTTEVIHGRLWMLRKIFIIECSGALIYFATKYCDYAKTNYNMLREIQRELQKLKSKGADVGKCLTDGINQSLSYGNNSKGSATAGLSALGYSGNHTLFNDNEVNSDEDIITDDSSDVSDGDSTIGTGSESEDPTFVMDVTREIQGSVQEMQKNISQLIVQPVVTRYNLRPRKNDVPELSFHDHLPSPKTFSDLLYNLTRSNRIFSARKRRNERKSGDFFSDDDE